MSIPFAELEEAIDKRISIRSFEDVQLTNVQCEQLQEFIRQLDIPFVRDVEISLHNANSSSYLPAKAPQYFAAFTSPDDILHQTMTGFLGELFVLYSVNLGLGTCWHATFKNNTVNEILCRDKNLNNKHIVQCITPLGYPARNSSITDKFLYTTWTKRKNSLKENLHEDSLAVFPKEIEESLELACKAPSGMNCQCWCFKVGKEDRYHTVEISRREKFKSMLWKKNDIDIGIAASHFYIGLNSRGVPFRVEVDAKEKSVWKFYIYEKNTDTII